jgi:hypothetical protein
MDDYLQEDPQLRSASKRLSRPDRSLQLLTRAEYWVAAITFVVGFGAMAVLSLRARTFSVLRPTVNFPLTALPSVVFGDSILLPVFNVRLFRFAKSYGAHHLLGRSVLCAALAVFLLALVGNAYLHHLWITNQSTVFTNAGPGQLSITGWWHFGFSIAETWLVLLFLLGWGNCFRSHNHVLAKLGMGTWAVLVYFSLLSFADFVVRDFYVLRIPSLAQALRLDYVFILFPALCILIMFVARRAYRNNQQFLDIAN